MKLFVERFEFQYCHSAGLTPGRPEVEQDNLTGIVAERERVGGQTNRQTGLFGEIQMALTVLFLPVSLVHADGHGYSLYALLAPHRPTLPARCARERQPIAPR